MQFVSNLFQSNFLFILLLLIIWQAFLTYSFFKTSQIFNKLTKGGNDKFETILKNLLKSVELNKKEIEEIKAQLEDERIQAKKYFQKYALLRYNPFKESGGDQSFVFVILNNKNDGLIISSLHARDYSRIYAKPITDGKSLKYELSKEETEALEQAIGQT